MRVERSEWSIFASHYDSVKGILKVKTAIPLAPRQAVPHVLYLRKGPIPSLGDRVDRPVIDACTYATVLLLNEERVAGDPCLRGFDNPLCLPFNYCRVKMPPFERREEALPRLDSLPNRLEVQNLGVETGP